MAARAKKIDSSASKKAHSGVAHPGVAHPGITRPGINGKSRMKGIELREQIVAAESRLFSDKGFSSRGTTTKEIAREVGVSEATIYKHFSGK